MVSSRSSMLLDRIHQRCERMRADMLSVERDTAELFKLYQEALNTVDALAREAQLGSGEEVGCALRDSVS